MSICHVNQFNQLETNNGTCINRPAVQIIAEDDLFIRFGEYETLSEQAHRESTAMFAQRDELIASGIPCTIPVQTVISLEHTSPADACYIIRRMAEYTASGFVKNFFQKMQKADAQSWLCSEMARVPINITE